jgi:hypothetical protein
MKNFGKFKYLHDTIDEYYKGAFDPEIIQAIEFIEESNITAELLSKYATLAGEEKEVKKFDNSKFQINLFYIQKKFKDSLSNIRLKNNHILFIDGIDNLDYQNNYRETFAEQIKDILKLSNNTFSLQKFKSIVIALRYENEKFFHDILKASEQNHYTRGHLKIEQYEIENISFSKIISSHP